MPPKRKNAKSSSEPDAKKSKSEDAKKSKSDEGTSKDKEKKMATVVIKGVAPVDTECHAMKDVAHVYYRGSDIYDAMLNQTNLQFNNNKYYVIQVLEHDTTNDLYVWNRWGRVGKSGQSKLEHHGKNVDAAINSFYKKFLDKTHNHWSCRNNFKKIPGKYDLLEMDYSKNDSKDSKDDDNDEKDKKDQLAIKSKLPQSVRTLIELICDVKMMEANVVQMKYDSEKAPLGRLTKAQIKAGYAALAEIEKWIKKSQEKEKGKSGRARGKSDAGEESVSTKTLLQACNDFYTRIPHDFGMRVPPMIKTLTEVKEKLNLLEALDNIEIAMEITQRKSKEKEHPTDRHYRALNCQMEPLDKKSDEYKIVENYLLLTHATTHAMYTMELLDVFTVDKDSSNFLDYGNKMLLWHGSRLTNWVGILSQGLRIAPPEAPSTGYMFGKGVYFADMSSKSANYTYTSRAKNVGILVLCEVSLGKPNELLSANFTANKLPSGCHSVKGMGRVAPDPKCNKTLFGDVTVPCGPGIDTQIQNPKGYTLNYNEYIVYNTRQIRMRYLLKVKFNYK